MKKLLAGAVTLLLSLTVASPVIGQPDSTDVPSIPDSLVTEGDVIWIGVTGGTAFEDFLGAGTEELVLSGALAYETIDGYFVEYAKVFVGDESAEETTVTRLGYALSQRAGLRAHAGVSILANGDNTYGVWADAMKELSIDRYVRVLADYDTEKSAFGLTLGYFLAL